MREELRKQGISIDTSSRTISIEEIGILVKKAETDIYILECEMKGVLKCGTQEWATVARQSKSALANYGIRRYDFLNKQLKAFKSQISSFQMPDEWLDLLEK